MLTSLRNNNTFTSNTFVLCLKKTAFKEKPILERRVGREPGGASRDTMPSNPPKSRGLSLPPGKSTPKPPLSLARPQSSATRSVGASVADFV